MVCYVLLVLYPNALIFPVRCVVWSENGHKVAMTDRLFDQVQRLDLCFRVNKNGPFSGGNDSLELPLADSFYKFEIGLEMWTQCASAQTLVRRGCVTTPDRRSAAAAVSVDAASNPFGFIHYDIK